MCLPPNSAGKGKLNYSADLLPVTRLRTVQMLDLLQQTWHHMDTGLKRALRLNDRQSDFEAAISKVSPIFGRFWGYTHGSERWPGRLCFANLATFLGGR